MGEFGAVSVVSGNIARKRKPYRCLSRKPTSSTKLRQSAAVLLAGLALVTLVLKEILERKTRINDVE